MKELSGLWKKTAKSGVVYLEGHRGDKTYIVFQNSQKTKEEHPDYTLHLEIKNREDDFLNETATEE